MVQLRLAFALGITSLGGAGWVSGPSGQTAGLQELWCSKGSPAFLEFTAVMGAGFAPDGRVWVSDSQGSLLVYSETGSIEREIGRKGEGPGEFDAPRFIRATPEGGVVVFDLGRRSLEYFDTAGNFERRVLLPSTVLNPKGMVVFPNGDVVVSGGVPTDEASLHQYTSDGREVRAWWPNPEPVGHSRSDFYNARYVAGGPIARTRSGDLLYSVSAPHAIYRFSIGDTVPILIASDPSLLVSVLDDFERTFVNDAGERVIQPRWFFDQSRAVFELGDGTIINTVTFEDRPVTMFEAYAVEGRLISRTESDRPYWVWDALPSGRVAASYQDQDTGEHVFCLIEYSVR